MPKRLERRQKPLFIVGIDEAGRGPLAGPVSVGAVSAKYEELPRLKKIFREIKGKDSKKLSPVEREQWFKVLKLEAASGALSWKVAHSTSTTIDRKGLSHAIRSALSRALFGTNADASISRVLLDGGLKAPQEFRDQKTIIKGDEKELLISLASICAKVIRDRIMIRLAKSFPQYGFEIHKGYGTRIHSLALKKHGPSKLHRLSFCSKYGLK